MHGLRRNGFTLIELLVVITIIAILAAILFPVFAASKAAAKATVALSNCKQLVLSNLMYSGDFDDYLPLGTAWNTGNDPVCLGAGVCMSTWAFSTAPYVKSSAILTDPTAPANPPVAASVMQSSPATWASFSTGFGYNYAFLSPVLPTVTGVSSTAAGEPANTVMLASKWVHSEDLNGSQIWGVGPFPGGIASDAAAESVDCSALASNCVTDWGRGGGFNDPTHIDIASEVAGAYTGGNAFRVAGMNTVGFLDGHARRMPYSRLAAGTNFNYEALPGQPGGFGAITITSAATYLWSLTKDCSALPYGPCNP